MFFQIERNAIVILYGIHEKLTSTKGYHTPTIILLVSCFVIEEKSIHSLFSKRTKPKKFGEHENILRREYHNLGQHFKRQNLENIKYPFNGYTYPFLNLEVKKITH